MSLPHRSRPPLLSSIAVLGASGLGAGLGGLPELGHAQDPLSLLSLATLAGVAGWMWWRSRRPARPLAALGLTLAPTAPPADSSGTLPFSLVAPRVWQARQGRWCLELRQGRTDTPGWSLTLRPSGISDRHWPLAHGATLDTLLSLARHLAGQSRLGIPAEARDAADLLEGDFEFLLPAARQRIMALAEGGYALQSEAGYRAISAQAAGATLAQSHTVPTGM